MVLFNKLIPKALRKIGYEVIEFDWNAIYSFNKVVKVFSSEKINQKINQELLKKAKSVKPDFVFILKGEPIFTETLDEIKKSTGAVMFNWFGDDPWEFPVFSGKVANYYDHFFTYDPYSIKLYNEIGQMNAHHLCYAYDMELTSQLKLNDTDKNKYSCEVAFIGSHYQKREELLKQIKDKFDLKIWGRGWKDSSCKDVYRGSALYGTDMLKAMKSVKILLNIHKGFEEGVEESGNGLNLRVIEGAACGAFQITNNQADLQNRFEIGKEIVAFENWNEAVEQIEYYLNKNEERENIGRTSYERCLKDHKMETRMKEMMSIIGK